MRKAERRAWEAAQWPVQRGRRQHRGARGTEKKSVSSWVQMSGGGGGWRRRAAACLVQTW